MVKRINPKLIEYMQQNPVATNVQIIEWAKQNLGIYPASESLRKIRMAMGLNKLPPRQSISQDISIRQMMAFAELCGIPSQKYHDKKSCAQAIIEVLKNV